MAPALRSPMTQQSPSSSPKRPRRMLPIIPAIPRSLEKKPKQAIQPPPSEGAGVVPPTTAISDGTQEEKTSSLANAQREDQDTPDDSQITHEPVELSPKNETLDVVNSLPSPQKPERGEHALDPASPYLSEPSSPTPSPPDGVIPELQSHAVQGSLPGSIGVNKATMSQQRPNHHTLRATASVFHAPPTPSDDVIASPTASTQQDADSAPSESFATQCENTSEATTPPIEPAYHGYGHAHNISFYAPPPQSTDDPSSPAHSVYQGYTYNHPQHAHASSQYSQSYQPQFEAYIPGSQYAQNSPYYGGMPPFSTLGSQAPLTPSATPLDTMPEPWSLPNGVSNGALEQGTHTSDLPRHRSGSHSTLKSDSLVSGGATMGSGQGQPYRNGANRMQGWHHPQADVADVADVASLHASSQEASLVKHLLRQFNNPEYADCELVLSHSEHRFPEAKWYLSSILLIQSRKLQDLLNSSNSVNAAQNGRRVLRFHLTDRFITPTAMESALHILYGKASNTFPPKTAVEANRASSECSTISMKESLAYAASGCLLHLKDVVLQGLKIASEILCWDNLEAALSFALESGLEREFNASSAVIPAYSSVLASDSDPSPSSLRVLTPSSSSDQAGQNENRTSASTSPANNQTRLPPQHAFDLVLHCLDYIVHEFPTSWELDLSARPLADVDRLPVTAESRSPLSKSRLSRIQFGDHPSEMESKSSDRNVLVSTIVLSVPFMHLEYLLSSVGERLGRNMEPVIKERERRRQIVVQSRSVSWNERMAAKSDEWAEAGYEESMDITDDGIIKISRKYTGIARNPTDENTTDG